MCLFYNSSRTNKVRKKLQNNKYCIFYKLVWDDFRPIYLQYYPKYTYGWNKSNRLNKRLQYYEYHHETHFSPIVDKGIHVYTNYIRVIHEQKTVSRPTRIIPVRCYLKDFIAAGSHGEAVFMRVFFSKKDYNKFLKANI